MARYPNWTVGTDVSAANLADGLPDYYVKEALEPRVNNSVTADAELSGIALAVGTYHVRLVARVNNASATPDLRTQWTFSGTWNNPNRIVRGPASSNTGNWDATTPLKFGGVAAGTSAIYGLAASAAWHAIEEEAFNVTVTVAGNLAFAWAQNSTDAANATNCQPGSAFIIKKLSD